MQGGHNHEAELRRTLGLLDATAMGLGAIIGGGIFVVVGVAAAATGPAVVVAILIAAVPAVLNGLSAAACAAAFPQAGGTYNFGRILLSPLAGFIAGWLYIFAEAAADAAVAIGFAGYLTALFPALPFRPVVIALGLLVTTVNYVGIGITSRVNTVLVALKIVALLFFFGAGVWGVQPANFSPFLVEGWYGVMQGSALLFFAYTGYARVATLAEEVREPKTTIPRAIVLALVIAIALYLTTTIVAIGLAGAGGIAGSPSPLVDAIRRTSIAFAPLVVVVGAMIATTSVFLTGLAGVSRVVFAMSRNGDLPDFLGYVDPKYFTPSPAVAIGGAAITFMAATLDLASLAAAASFALLVYYAITNVAAMRLDRETRGFSIILPITGVAFCVVLAAALPFQEIIAGLVVIAVGIVYYLVKNGVWLSTSWAGR